MQVNKLPNINDWVVSFKETSTFHAIKKNISQLTESNIQYMIDAEDISHIDDDQIINITPRHHQLSRRICDLQPFYILEYMAKNGIGPIYDVGCGFNWFKNFYNIIGIDPNPDYADRRGLFDRFFATTYHEHFDNVFSINAVHFCSTKRLANVIDSYFSLVKLGGYAYLAINTARIYERTHMNHMTNGNQEYDKDKTAEISNIVKETVSSLPGDVLLYEDRSDMIACDGLNGNIRILIKR